MYSLHHVVKFPNHLDHQDPTTINHTLVLRVVLPVICLMHEYDLNYQLKDLNHHANRKFVNQLMPLMVNNQKDQWNISKHLHFHIFLNIHHKNHKLELFVLTRDYHVKLLFFHDIWPKKKIYKEKLNKIKFATFLVFLLTPATSFAKKIKIF